VWRHLLYAVCIAEAALPAAILVAVVFQPDFAPSPGGPPGLRMGPSWR
jgi:hypothetical protein